MLEVTFTGASRDGSRGEDLSWGGQVTECAVWDGRGSSEAEPLPPPQFSNGPWFAFASASLPWVRTLALGSSTSSKAPRTGPLPIPCWPGPLGLASPRLGAGTCPHLSASPPLHFPLPSFPPSPPPRGEAAAAAAAEAAEAEAAAAAAAAAGGARLGLRGRAGGHGGQHVPGRR